MAEQETLDQVVQRLMTEACSFGGFPSSEGVRVVHSTNVDFEAAIRQGIAFAYRDAARESKMRAEKAHALLNTRTDDQGEGIIIGAENAFTRMVELFERKAEEAGRDG